MTEANDRSAKPGRGVSRRQLLIGGAGAGGALALGGVLAHGAVADSATSTPTVHLQVLSNTEAALYGAMADRIFPADSDSPGAQQLGFVAYLDGQLASAWGAGEGLYKDGPHHDPTTSGLGYQLGIVPKDLYKLIAPKIDAYAQHTAGGAFSSLTGTQQDTIMTNLQAGQVDLGLATTEYGYTSAAFFADFQAVVNQALFSDPMYGGNVNVGGWEWIGYPGDPMAYGDAYWAIFGQQDDPYIVTPKGMADSTMGGFQGIEGSDGMSGMETDS